jgi:hypothetical protein
VADAILPSWATIFRASCPASRICFKFVLNQFCLPARPS